MAAAKAYFLQSNADGVSMHSHLAELIQSVLLSKDNDALEKLESLSLEVKAGHFNADEPIVKDQSNGVSAAALKWLQESKALFKVELEDDAGVPDLLGELAFFEWAGVGLSKEEAYRLLLAITKIKKDENLATVRFFGKILGTRADYYVIEATYAAPPAATASPRDQEPPGTGLNACTYFVSNKVTGPFTALADVTPEQVLASSKIKKYFTGDLTATVACTPPFPGSEAAYLRAQIARISAGTVILPVGRLAVDDESEAVPPPLIPAEGYEPPEPEAMKSADAWCHLYGKILANGRVLNPPPIEYPEGEEPDEPEEFDEEVPPLLEISGDEPVSTLLEDEECPSWSFSLFHELGSVYAVAVARSLRWPGAYAASYNKGDKCTNVYIGYGHERTGASFTPLPPPSIMAEGAEPEEIPDTSVDAENELLKAIDEAKMAREAEEEED